MNRLAIAAATSAALLFAAAGAALAQSDILEGPLLRPERSSADPRDLSGVWFLRLYNRQIMSTRGRIPPFTPHGKAEWDKRVAAEKDGKPIADASAYCWPHGTPRVMNSPYPIQIIQTKGKTTIVHEVNHNIRHIYMDEALPQTVEPSFLGTSVGRWEGDTLVIETKGVSDMTWIDEVGVIHGKQMKVTERIRKIEDGEAIEDLIKIEDPEFFTRPWFMRDTYAWRPDLRIAEYVCEENNRNMPVNGRTVAQ